MAVVTTVVVDRGMQGPVAGLDYHVALEYFPEGSDVPRFDVALWDAPASTWVGTAPLDDVSCNVRDVRIARGRDRPLERFRPGACTFTLYDPEGTYSPWRTASDETAFTAIRPGIGVRVWVDDGTTTYPRFAGIVDSIVDVFPDPGVDDSHEVIFSCFDYLGVVAAFDGYELPSVGANEYAGARVGRILANASYTGPRALDPGTFPLQATTLAKNALDEIGLVCDTDLGAFYCDRTGTLTYRDLAGLSGDAHYATVQATFGEVEPEICYVDVKLADDLARVQNDVSIAPDGGTAARVTDLTSIGLYQPRTFRRFDLLHANGADSSTIANAHLSAYAYAVTRIEQLTVDLLLLEPADRLVVLALDLLYRIQVRRRAAGFQVVADLQIQAIGETVDANSWAFTFDTFDAATVFDIGRYDVDVWDSGLWGY